MPDQHSDRFQGAVIAAMLLAGLCVVVALPSDARVAIHFDANGQPSGWASPAMAVFLMPVLAWLLWGLMRLLHKIDPRGDNLRQSAGAVRTISLTLTCLLAAVQAVIVAGALGAPAPKSSFGLLLVGGVLLVTGNVMGKLRPNHFVGIRTPWTLANDRVWDQTHRYGGKVFVLGGALLCVLGALSLVPGREGPAILVVTLACGGLVTWRSYRLWRALPPH